MKDRGGNRRGSRHTQRKRESPIPSPFSPLPIKKRTPASESANPSSQHQLYGSIVPIWTERRKIDLGWLLVIRLGCISPSAYDLHKMLQEQ